MKYSNIKEATFLERENRFVAHCALDGQEVTVHVKNTGRCRELLVPGTTVYLQHFPDREKRRTSYDLISVYKGKRLINMDAQAPNKVVEEGLKKGFFDSFFGHAPQMILPEQRLGESRLDFRLALDDKTAWMEVKGVTLEEDGVVYFPDAPTERGVRHLQQLCTAAAQGMQAWAVLVIQMEGVSWFEPNLRTHPRFGEVLRQAAGQGVHLLAIDCKVTEDTLELNQEVEVRL